MEKVSNTTLSVNSIPMASCNLAVSQVGTAAPKVSSNDALMRYAKATGSEILLKSAERQSLNGQVLAWMNMENEGAAMAILDQMKGTSERIPFSTLEIAASKKMDKFVEKVFARELQEPAKVKTEVEPVFPEKKTPIVVTSSEKGVEHSSSCTSVHVEKKGEEFVKKTLESHFQRAEEDLKYLNAPKEELKVQGSPQIDKKAEDELEALKKIRDALKTPGCPSPIERAVKIVDNLDGILALAETGDLSSFTSLCKLGWRPDNEYIEKLFSYYRSGKTTCALDILQIIISEKILPPTATNLVHLIYMPSLFQQVASYANPDSVMAALQFHPDLRMLRWFMGAYGKYMVSSFTEPNCKLYMQTIDLGDWTVVQCKQWYELIPVMMKRHGPPAGLDTFEDKTTAGQEFLRRVKLYIF